MPGDRLVPFGYEVPLEEHLRARARAPRVMSGYPARENLLVMTRQEIRQWEANGMPYQATRRNVSPRNPLGTNYVDHPNRRKAVENGLATRDDGVQTFHHIQFSPSLIEGGYKLDSRGVPKFPEYQLLLQLGAACGPGFYYKLGPNPVVDPVTFGVDRNHLYVAAITKGTPRILLPGGMVEPGEQLKKTAVREVSEEIGLDLDPRHIVAVYRGLLGNSPRTTLDAWEESTALLIISKSLGKITKKKLRAGDDAKSAFWHPVTAESLEGFALDHAAFIRKAVLAFEQIEGVTVYEDGSVKRN